MFTAPRHPYTRKLLSSFPNIHADRRTLDVIPGRRPTCATPPPGCRFAPRCATAMPVCREEVPPEVRFADGVRVACHLFPPGADGARCRRDGRPAPTASAMPAMRAVGRRPP